MNIANAEQELTIRFRDSISQSRSFGYDPSVFEKMLNEHGAIGTVKRLIKASDPQSGFRRLVNEGRVDLTMEKIMREEQFASLFNKDELEWALYRLENPNLF